MVFKENLQLAKAFSSLYILYSIKSYFISGNGIYKYGLLCVKIIQ